MTAHTRTAYIAAALFVTSFVALFHGVITKLVVDWGANENYSHGFLIVPLAAYFAWERRAQLRGARLRASWFGAIIVTGSVAVMVAGVLGAELFLTRMAMIGVLAGSTLFVLGPDCFRILAFPLGLLLLMVPLPAIVFNQIAFPLQLLASRAGEAALSAAQIPVYRDGNVIVLASATLEVAEACSGIRSLVSLLALGIVYGYFTDRRQAVRIALALATVPIAIAANALRVAGTGIAAHFVGAAAAEGFLHTFSGWLMFVAAFGMLILVHRLVFRLNPAATTPSAAVARAA
jgi:exosortase